MSIASSAENVSGRSSSSSSSTINNSTVQESQSGGRNWKRVAAAAALGVVALVALVAAASLTFPPVAPVVLGGIAASGVVLGSMGLLAVKLGLLGTAFAGGVGMVTLMKKSRPEVPSEELESIEMSRGQALDMARLTQFGLSLDNAYDASLRLRATTSPALESAEPVVVGSQDYADADF